jgi:hypothetical protein
MAHFEPYIFIETSEKRPSSISNAAWTGNQMKYINLDGTLSPADLSTVHDLVREHFKMNQGKCPLYGEITGYRFVFSPTESIVLNTEGNELRRENGQFWPRSISMGDADRVTPAP